MTNNNPQPQFQQQPVNYRPVNPQQPPMQQQPATRKSGVPAWATVLCAVGMLLVGNLVGCGVGSSSSTPSEDDIKSSQTYKDLESKYKAAKDSSSAKKDELAKLDKEISDAQAKLDQLTGQVEQVKKNTLKDGTWTVGTDIEAGTYRASKEVGSDCYWSITAGGSNGSDIIANDIPGGGYPQFTVEDGQQIRISNCRVEFRKIG